MPAIDGLMDLEQFLSRHILRPTDQGPVVDAEQGAVVPAVAEAVALIEGQPPAAQGLPGGVPVFRGLRLPEDAPEVGVVLRKQVQHPAAQAPVPQAGHGAQVVQQGKGTARLQPNQGVGDQILPVVQAQGLVASLLHEGEHGAQGLELLWGKGGGQLLTVQLGQLLGGELIQLHGVQTPLS